MTQLPYLQPFDDVNKHVSRIAANISFLRATLSPLSFTDLPRDLYPHAMLGVYELNRIELLWRHNDRHFVVVELIHVQRRCRLETAFRLHRRDDDTRVRAVHRNPIACRTDAAMRVVRNALCGEVMNGKSVNNTQRNRTVKSINTAVWVAALVLSFAGAAGAQDDDTADIGSFHSVVHADKVTGQTRYFIFTESTQRRRHRRLPLRA